MIYMSFTRKIYKKIDFPKSLQKWPLKNLHETYMQTLLFAEDWNTYTVPMSSWSDNNQKLSQFINKKMFQLVMHNINNKFK